MLSRSDQTVNVAKRDFPRVAESDKFVQYVANVSSARDGMRYGRS
jgi:hypothetical protein